MRSSRLDPRKRGSLENTTLKIRDISNLNITQIGLEGESENIRT
jgi:hypothetical protein